MKVSELIERMRVFRKAWVAKHGGDMFSGIPTKWYDNVHFRCANDHVSRTVLKSEIKGDLCLQCQAPCLITFPEDKDGPFPEAP